MGYCFIWHFKSSVKRKWFNTKLKSSVFTSYTEHTVNVGRLNIVVQYGEHFSFPSRWGPRKQESGQTIYSEMISNPRRPVLKSLITASSWHRISIFFIVNLIRLIENPKLIIFRNLLFHLCFGYQRLNTAVLEHVILLFTWNNTVEIFYTLYTVQIQKRNLFIVDFRENLWHWISYCHIRND